MKINDKVIKIIKYIYKDNLYRNGIYLMIGKFVPLPLGFLFLMIASHLYSSQDVGIYSALSSAMGLIILFSMTYGFGNALLRLIPILTETNKNRLIVSSFVTISFTITILSLIFVIFVDVFSYKLIFLKDLFYGGIFILFTIFFGMYSLFDYIFMLSRKSQYIIIKQVVQGIAQIILLFLFVSFLYFGIFSSAGIGILFGTICSLFLLYKAKLIKNFKLTLDFSIIKKNFKYILTNYLSSIASELPGLIFPILVLNILSAENTAYFFVSWTIFSAIMTLVMSMSISFFVEGSYNEIEIKKNRNKGLKASLIIATICLIGVFLFGKFVLSLFGEEYLNSLNLLYIFTISIYFFVINKIYLIELLIKKKNEEILIFNYLISGSVIAFGILFMFYFGLNGIGYGWLLGQIIGIIWIFIHQRSSIKEFLKF